MPINRWLQKFKREYELKIIHIVPPALRGFIRKAGGVTGLASVEWPFLACV